MSADRWRQGRHCGDDENFGGGGVVNPATTHLSIGGPGLSSLIVAILCVLCRHSHHERGGRRASSERSPLCGLKAAILVWEFTRNAFAPAFP